MKQKSLQLTSVNHTLIYQTIMKKLPKQFLQIVISVNRNQLSNGLIARNLFAARAYRCSILFFSRFRNGARCPRSRRSISAEWPPGVSIRFVTCSRFRLTRFDRSLDHQAFAQSRSPDPTHAIPARLLL